MTEEFRRLPSKSGLDNLKKEAKRWLKALRANDAAARQRLNRWHPQASEPPVLRDVQHALAREHGFSGWAKLKEQLGSPSATGLQGEYVSWFLEQACPDWNLGGPAAQAAAQESALRILNRHSQIARQSLYTAAVCGELDEVDRILAGDPAAVSREGGPKRWTPLHYLCFARLRLPSANDNAVTIARKLLDAGADPNAYFKIGEARHTPLVGVIGGGEELRAPHPQAEALVDLLLDRGADACDYQVVYNVTQDHSQSRWISRLYAHSTSKGRRNDWTDRGAARGLHGLSAFGWLLQDAVWRNDLSFAEWLLANGAEAAFYADAVRRGLVDMADLLVRFGATPNPVEMSDEEAFTAACLRMDRSEARAILARHPEYRHSPRAIFAAAEQDRADVVDLLLELGVPIEVEDNQKQRPLHIAAAANAVRVAQLLIERGAEVDAREANWNNTPLGHAVYGQKREMTELLSRYSREVFDLTYLGNIDRLREVLYEQPALATTRDRSGATPLMWIVRDRVALDLIELLISHGADPAVQLKDGRTAADVLARRGLFEAANALRWIGRSERVASFLRMACLDWRVDGPDRLRQMHAAGRLLQRHPEIARDSIYTASACGDLEHVERILNERPEAAVEPGGPRGWPPLLYLCSARLPVAAASESAVAIARALIDHGADPNVYYPGGDPSIHYSALTCVMGRGEEQALIHSNAEALAELLLERGAEPYDIQVFYNVFAGHASQRHMGDEVLWLMDLVHRYSIARGRQKDWEDPHWRMLDMGGRGSGVRYLMGCAIQANHIRLAEWLLAHGADPNAPPASDNDRFKGSLYEAAMQRGRIEIANLLLRAGAKPAAVSHDDENAFVSACLRLDGDGAEALLARHPEYRQSTKAMFAAAETDRADVVEFLLNLGVPIDVEEPGSRVRTLHTAAYNGAVRVTRLLIERGAEIDFMDNQWDATPIRASLWGQKPQTLDVLAPVSRDVWTLVEAGKVQRLRELLGAEPRLAKVTYQNQSPLFWLPDDEENAAAIVALFLEHGADPSLRNRYGKTAADVAVERGLEAASQKLRPPGL